MQIHRSDTEPFVIAVRDGADRVVAIAPWSLEHRPERLGKRHVTGIGGGDGWYHDPLGGDAATSAAIVGCLKTHRALWDTLRLRIRPDRSRSLVAQLRQLGLMVEQQSVECHHRLIDLSAGWEAYWQELPSSLRRNLRSAERKLQSLPHRFLEIDAAHAEPWLDVLFRMHQDRWTTEQDQEAFYAMKGPDSWLTFYAFLRAMVTQVLPEGPACLYALEIQGRPAAIDLVLPYGTCAYGTLRAYDPEFRPLSAGHLLNNWEFQRLNAQGIETIDLGSGLYPYKERLRNALQEAIHVEIASGLRGTLHGGWHGHLKPWLVQQPAWNTLNTLMRRRPTAPQPS
ncbi:MAG TPA: GNAT family N-acetyltransferase [Stenomitos sp.]